MPPTRLSQAAIWFQLGSGNSDAAADAPLEHLIDDGLAEIFVVGEVGDLTYGTYRFINFHRCVN